MKAVKILQSLKPTEPLYKAKIKILAQLIEDRDGGHILDGRLVKWADKVGIKTKLHCEDKTSWWSCRI
jgi:hypothetical protein